MRQQLCGSTTPNGRPFRAWVKDSPVARTLRRRRYATDNAPTCGTREPSPQTEMAMTVPPSIPVPAARTHEEAVAWAAVQIFDSEGLPACAAYDIARREYRILPPRPGLTCVMGAQGMDDARSRVSQELVRNGVTPANASILASMARICILDPDAPVIACGPGELSLTASVALDVHPSFEDIPDAALPCLPRDSATTGPFLASMQRICDRILASPLCVHGAISNKFKSWSNEPTCVVPTLALHYTVQERLARLGHLDPRRFAPGQEWAVRLLRWQKAVLCECIADASSAVAVCSAAELKTRQQLRCAWTHAAFVPDSFSHIRTFLQAANAPDSATCVVAVDGERRAMAHLLLTLPASEAWPADGGIWRLTIEEGQIGILSMCEAPLDGRPSQEWLRTLARQGLVVASTPASGSMEIVAFPGAWNLSVEGFTYLMRKIRAAVSEVTLRPY